jgi:hypothetical protein
MSPEFLAICTPRQTAEFLAACGVDAERLEVESAAKPAQREVYVQQVLEWLACHPAGQVVSWSDHPSVIHALAAARKPGHPGLSGASVAAVLATIDKAWTRADVVPEAGNLRWELAHDGGVAPAFEANRPVFFKPLDGCASAGVKRLEPGEPIPKVAAGSWLEPLQAEFIDMAAPYDREAIGLVEEYVAPDFPRVSVDGWVAADGAVTAIAVSDNCYDPERPEQFLYQRYPSALSPGAQWACKELYRVVAERLVARYGLREQPFDVEMFVMRDLQGVPRPVVMEVNARLHPNITPILHRAFYGLDLFDWHRTGPRSISETGLGGVMWYVWGGRQALDEERIRRRLEPFDSRLCMWSEPGARSGDRYCWGWCYLFGDDVDRLVSSAHEIFRPS